MTATLHPPVRPRWLWAFGAVVGAEVLLARQPFVQAAPERAVLLALDLFLLPLVLGYVLAGRRWQARWAVPMGLVGLALASTAAPGALAWMAAHPHGLLLLLEAVPLLWIGHQGRRLWRTYQTARAEAVYATDAAWMALHAHLPRPVARFVGTELMIGAFALRGWGRTYRPPVGAQAFSMHRRAGGVVLGLALASLVEAPVVHLLLHAWSPALAWGATAVSLYGLFWLAGFHHALRLHPVVVTPTHLHLRQGLHWRLSVPRSGHARLRTLCPGDAERRGLLSMAVGRAPTFVLELPAPVQVQGLFGLRRTVQAVAFAVDDAPGFVAALKPAATDGAA